MAALLGSSSSSPPAGEDSENEYDVFLSFRGPDTRLNIADSLYAALDGAGFRVFKDDEDHRYGEKIERKIMGAITGSKIYIPIFSPNFASSKWCLREIAYMVECKGKSSDKEILPVFYDVDAHDVKLKTDLYRNALEKHSSKSGGKDGKEQWEEALIEAARIEGLNLRDLRQDKLIKLTVEKVRDWLSTRSKGKVSNGINSWQRGKILREGSFATVYEGLTDDGRPFAVKEVKLLDLGSQGKQSVLELQQEISHLSRLKHENIVRYLGSERDDEKLYIFLELVTQVSLAKLYRDYQLSESQVSTYTRQILNGLKYLHDQNVVHRDIKCANILLDASGCLKLADFGLLEKANKINRAKTSIAIGFWMAPEVVNPRKKCYGSPADIWSLGCTVLEMFTRQPPYSNLDRNQALRRIGDGKRPEVPDSLSSEAHDFILRCLQRNPNRRPTAVQLLGDPFVKV